jgi:hypothetical protein
MRRLHSPGRRRRQRTTPKDRRENRLDTRLKPNRREDTVLRDQINDAVKTAMKSQDKLRLSTLRMVNSAIKNADIEARGAGKGPLGDGDILGLLQKLIKQRQESV